MANIFKGGYFSLDPLALFFLAVIGLVCLPSAVFSIGYLKDENRLRKILAWALLAVFVFSMCMVVSVANLFLFLVFWELMSLASYFLVVFDYKHDKSIRAGTIYLVMTHLGTACLMAAFLILYNHAGSFDFSAVSKAALMLNHQTRNVIFLMLLAAFATKAGVVPLHVWLPYAHPQAPAHISSIMSGVMIKVAVYGMIRFFMMILAPAEAWWGGLLIALGALSCLVGVIYALMDNDLKRLLAYCSIENIGVILLGVGTAILFGNLGINAVAAIAMCAGLYHVINHALFKGLLFLGSGSVYKATHTRDIEKLGALIRAMPATALFFLIGSMAVSALPPMNGFVSEWLTFQAFFSGVIRSSGWVKISMVLSASVLALTSGLAAASFVKAFGITFLAMPRSARASEAKECDNFMKAGMAMLALLVILFGVCAGALAPRIYGVAKYALGLQPDAATISFKMVSAIPLVIAAGLTCIGLAVLLWFKFGLRTSRRIYNTWDCGYYAVDSRNEYTATAFSKPLRIAFSFFLLPYRKSEKIRDSFYHVRKFTYETRTTPVFNNFFYEPLAKLVYWSAFKIKRLQPGSIHLYILYIFAALVCLIAMTAVF